jgi:hypothetical protein
MWRFRYPLATMRLIGLKPHLPKARILHSIPLWHFTCSPFGDCRSRRKRDVARQTQGFQRCEAFQDFFSRV